MSTEEEAVDLNIDNYNLDEVLALFELSQDFKFEDLKRAFVNYVAPLHPDKSGLSSEYFIFYRKAYGVLINLYKMRTNKVYSDKMDARDYEKYAEKYKNEFKEQEEQNRSYAETLMKSDNFNETFNQLFEDNVKKNEEDAGGYDDWLRCGGKQEERIVDYDQLVAKRTQDVDQFKQEIRQMTMDEFQIEFEKRRAEIISGTEIMSRDGFGAISSMSSAGATSLLGGPIGDYSSAHGGAGLAYQDLKRAHTDTLIPVDIAAMSDRFMRSSDYETMLNDRKKLIEPLGKEESERILNDQYKTDESTNIRNTFKLMQQEEQQKKIMDKIWGKLKQLSFGDK
jgi:hypothetical protein